MADMRQLVTNAEIYNGHASILAQVCMYALTESPLVGAFSSKRVLATLSEFAVGVGCTYGPVAEVILGVCPR